MLFLRRPPQLRALPEGEAKAWSQLNLRSVWAQYDPKAAEQWFKTLPAATQAQVLDLAKKTEIDHPLIDLKSKLPKSLC